MDPLTLLRDFCMAGKLDKVVRVGDRIEFGDEYSFDEKMLTAFKSKRGHFYALQALYFFMKNKDIEFGKYVSMAMKEKVEKISGVDKKVLADYLTGKIETCDRIATPDQLPVAVIAGAKRGFENDGQQRGDDSKRARVGEQQDGDVKTSGAGTSILEGSKEQLEITSFLEMERQLRDRNTQLNCPGKEFTFAVDLAKKCLQNSRHRHKNGSHKGGIPVKPSGRYERELPQNQVENIAGKEFANIGISPYGYRGRESGRPSGNDARSSRQPAIPRDPSHRSSSHRRLSGQGHRSGSSRKSSTEGAMPIILIPPGLSSKLNMYNARQFLEKGTYVSPEECRQNGAKKKDTEIFKRTFDRKKGVPYQITDKPPPKQSKDWKRVVAVICQGVKWQFKEFPFKGAANGEMIETFCHMKGYYMAFHNEDLNPLVKSWAVKVLTVHKDNRHSDNMIMQDFYRTLDAFLLRKKSKLAY